MECTAVKLDSNISYFIRGVRYIAAVFTVTTTIGILEMFLAKALGILSETLSGYIFGASLLSYGMLALGSADICMVDYVKNVRGYSWFTDMHFIKRAVKIAPVLYILTHVSFPLMLYATELARVVPSYWLVVAIIFIFYAWHFLIIMERYIGGVDWPWLPFSDLVDVHREVRQCVARRGGGLLTAYWCWLTAVRDQETYRLLECAYKSCPFVARIALIIFVLASSFPVVYLFRELRILLGV